jgi:hypothetical protein
MQRGLHDSVGKSSEWPQFSGPPRGPDITVTGQRSDQRRNVTNPSSHLGVLGPAYEPKLPVTTVSASATPSIAQHHTPNDSRRSSPPGMADTLSALSNIATARSVPATPLGGGGVAGVRSDVSAIGKSPGTPGTGSGNGGGIVSGNYSQHPGGQHGGAGLGEGQGGVSATDLSATLSRLGNGQYENPVSFGSIQQNTDESLQVCIRLVIGWMFFFHDHLSTVTAVVCMMLCTASVII